MNETYANLRALFKDIVDAIREKTSDTSEQPSYLVGNRVNEVDNQ